MPYSVHGIGTGLVAASRKRKVDGQTQFDAIEAGMFFYLPLLPYKVLHVISIGSDFKNMDPHCYRAMPLHFSWLLIIKAFLNRWGNLLFILGILSVGTDACIFVTKNRPLGSHDLTVFTAILVVGVIFKLAWFVLSRTDDKIKELIIPYSQSSSDPWYWISEHAEETVQSILQQESLTSLVEVARRAILEGKRSFAAFCLRLAMRDPNNIEAQDLMNKMLTVRWTP